MIIIMFLNIVQFIVFLLLEAFPDLQTTLPSMASLVTNIGCLIFTVMTPATLALGLASVVARTIGYFAYGILIWILRKLPLLNIK